MYDVIVVGMGPAGMSAGIYAKRGGLETLILEKNAPGGLINTTNIVDNYLGFDNITGPDLAYKMFMHTMNNGVDYKIEEVIKIKKEKDYFLVKTNKGEYKTKTVILSGGRQAKKHESEEGLKNLKVSRCSICDAPLYKDKEIVVIGGGNSAFEEGIYLSEFASTLKIITRGKVKADTELVEEAKQKNNITIIEDEIIENITDEDGKYKIKLKNETITSDGLFSYIGYVPSTEYLSNLNILEENGYVLADNGKTLVPGIFACGDIIKKDLYQIVTAVSEGANCAIEAKKYITKLGGK